MQIYISRIKNHNIKLIAVTLIILLPQIEAIQVWVSCNLLGLELYAPMYATLLSLPGIAFHIIAKVFLWFLPLYLILIFGEMVIEEAETYSSNMWICRMGKQRYISFHVWNSFFIGFLLVLASLLINILVCVILFHGGVFLGVDPTDSPYNQLYTFSNLHPLIANVAFAVITSFFGGLIGCIGASVALIIPDRRIVYSMGLMLWLIPVAAKKSLMLVFQPFSEFDWNDLLPIAMIVMFFYLAVIGSAVYLRSRKDEL